MKLRRRFLIVLICSMLSLMIQPMLPEQQVEAAASIISQWKFDEGAGNITKEAISGSNNSINYIHNNAKYKPSTDPIWRSDGISNSALLFDGYSNWVTNNPISTPSQAMSIEAWIAPRAYEWGDNGVVSAIVNQHDKSAKQGFLLGVFRHGSWTFQVGANGNWYELWSYEPLPKFEWSHISATVDGINGNMKLFLNGKEVASRTIPSNSSISHSNNPLLIGKNNQSTQLAVFPLNMFNGLIDEVKITNGSYSESDAQSSYLNWINQLGGNIPTPNLTFDRSVYDGDKHRPTYHAIAPGHWMNEPHAPLYYNGQYHLFYQNNQHGPYWHNMHWGHWVSDDMVHWRDLPPAIAPELFQVDPDGDWTGTAVIDDQGNPTLFFTAGNDARPYIQSNQNVGVARSTVMTDGDNDLTKWVKESKLAVAQQPGQGKAGEFRDPYVFKDGDTWFMLVGTGVEGQGGTVAVYSTTDSNLMDWSYRGPLYQNTNYPYLGGVWELPVLLPLGNGKHVLAISPVGSGANVEVFYWIGVWNKTTAKFTPDHQEPQLMDFGDFKFTGPSGFADPVTGRNILFTIAQGERGSQEEFDSGWAHNAGLPVELSLRSDGRLGIKPISELQSLRGQQLINITSDTSLSSANTLLNSISSDTLEIEIELNRGSADGVGMKVRKSPNSEEETLIYYNHSTDEYGVDRTKTVAGVNKGIQKGNVDIGSENVKLHIYLDKSMVESYLNDLKSITTRTYSTRNDAKGLQLWANANAGSVVVKSLKVWAMNSAYTPVPVSGINIDPANLQVSVGGKKSITPIVMPQNATNKNVIWSSSHPNVATVVNGVVTGIAPGSATITATTRNGSKTASSAVTVSEPTVSVNLLNGDFETGNLAGWNVESGGAFSNLSITNQSTFQDNQPFNHEGTYHLFGLMNGDAATGVLKSNSFTLGGNGQISFLAGGGSDIDKLYVSFVRASDHKELFRSSGPGTYWNWQSVKGVTESYTKRYWDATNYIGTEMYIKIVDERTDSWGHINVDEFIVPIEPGSIDTEAPTAPTDLAVTGKTAYEVSLSWTASTDNKEVMGYDILRDGNKIATTTATSFTDEGLNEATSYTYSIKSIDTSGNFSLESDELAITTDVAPPTSSLLNHDFESGDLTGWTIVSGDAFSAADISSAPDWGWGGPFGQSGEYHLWGFNDGEDSQVGVLKSETFTLGGYGKIDFLIGGGNNINNLHVALVRASDGAELFKATGADDEAYSRVRWDASAFIGIDCYIKIVDSATGGWGHLNVDDVNVPVAVGEGDTQAPTTPTQLTSPSKTSSTVTLSWSASTDNVGVQSYVVYRNGTEVGTTLTASYTDTGLTASTAYIYTVKAKDAAGNLSVSSNSLNVTTEAALQVGSLTNHDFESGNLTGWTIASGNAFSTADISSAPDWGWGGPFGQSGTYHLWGFKDGGDSQIGVLKSETFTLGGNGKIDFLIGGGNNINNLYVALVRASDGVELFKATGSDNEAYSRVQWDASARIGIDCYIKIVDNATGGWGHLNVDDVNVPVAAGGADTQAPTAPSQLTSSSKTHSTVALTWSASTDNAGVQSYVVYRNGTEVGTASTTSYTDTVLTASTAYIYTVKAKDAAGNLSVSSNSLNVTTEAVPQVGSLTNHDFESGNLTGWTIVSGNAFSAADISSALDWGWGGPFGQSGTYHLWGFKEGGDSQVGVLKSETFALGGTGQIDFLIGGGNNISNLYVALVREADGAELFKATGADNEAYNRVHWDVSAWIGTDCYIKIVDNATGGWGHLNVDDVNVPAL
ncbi:GH32 C-terminal domain-containing protein [Paenibacillus sp. 2TAB23]